MVLTHFNGFILILTTGYVTWDNYGHGGPEPSFGVMGVVFEVPRLLLFYYYLCNNCFTYFFRTCKFLIVIINPVVSLSTLSILWTIKKR